MAYYEMMPAGLPAGLQSGMDSVLNKKFGTATSYAPGTWPDTVNLMGPLPEATATGSIAHITDGADEVPIKSWEVSLPASLDGYSAIGCNKGGKNFIDFNSNLTSGTSGGLTFSATADGGISYSGTASSTVAYMTAKFDFSIASGDTFTFSRDTAFNYIHRITLTFTDNTTANVSIASGDTSVTYTPSKDVKAVRLLVTGLTNGTAYSAMVYLQTEYGNTATSYEAYTAPTTYTVELGETVYGGSVDFVSGEVVNDCAKDSMSSSYLSGLSLETYIGYEAQTAYFNYHPSIWVRNWNYQKAKARQSGGIGAICNYFPISMHNTTIFSSQNRIYFDVNEKNISSVSDFIAFVQNLEANNESLDIVYELNDTYSTDFTFTPITPTPETALGTNNFWADEGDTEVTYRRDIDLALQSLSGSRGLMIARPPAAAETEDTEPEDETTETIEETPEDMEK